MADLKYCIQYFKAHNDHWDSVSQSLGQVLALAREAPAADGALWTTLVPGFKSTHDKICGLIIDNLLAKSVPATRRIGDKLESTARWYATTEAANEEEAQKILTEVGYE